MWVDRCLFPSSLTLMRLFETPLATRSTLWENWTAVIFLRPCYTQERRERKRRDGEVVVYIKKKNVLIMQDLLPKLNKMDLVTAKLS